MFSTATITASAIFVKWTNNILSSLDPLIRLSKQTGVSTQYIQEMGYAATITGSSIQAIEQTITSLSRKIGSATLSGNADFSRLGISIRKATGEIKTADEVLGEISKRFKEMNLSLSQQVTIAESLGVDSSLIELLGKTSREIKDLRDQSKGFGILTKAQTEQVDAYNRSVSKLRFNFEGIKRLIAVGLSPELETLTKKFDKLLFANQDLIVNGISAFAEAIGELISLFGRLYPVLLSMGAIFLAIKVAIGGIGAVFGGWITLISALILLIDDVWIGLKGGKSVSGDYSKKLARFEQDNDYDFMMGIGKDLTGDKNSPGMGSLTQNNIINVSPRDSEIGNVIKDTLQEQINDASLQLQGGGM